jgi:hypothetical protein
MDIDIDIDRHRHKHTSTAGQWLQVSVTGRSCSSFRPDFTHL